MGQIMNMINNVFEFIKLGFNFLIQFLTDLGNMIILIYQVIAFLTTALFNIFPAPLFAIFSVCLTTTVLYRVLGRD